MPGPNQPSRSAASGYSASVYRPIAAPSRLPVPDSAAATHRACGNAPSRDWLEGRPKNAAFFVLSGTSVTDPSMETTRSPQQNTPGAPSAPVGPATCSNNIRTGSAPNGITIDYSTAGDGPPVLLICGTGQPADLWFAQVTDLAAAGHTVITFDNRGCGRSEAPPAPYSVTGMAADTAALIEHLGLGPCDVIGYSLGGYIAQELAVTRAGLVRRLVLLAGTGPAPAYAVARARAAADLARALDPLPPSFDVADLLLSLHPMAQLQNDDDAVKVTISLIEAAEQWANPGRLGQYQADLAWLEDSSHLDRLDRIKSACLAMAFEHDCWFPPRAVRQAAERIPSCQYTELPGLGHGAPC